MVTTAGDLITTVGGADSNSYVDSSQGAALTLYAKDVPVVKNFHDDVEYRSGDGAARALYQAAVQMEHFEWLGTKAGAEQALAWPRAGVEGVRANVVPVDVMRAQALFAAYLMDDPARWLGFEIESAETGAAKKLKIGDFEMEFLGNRASNAVGFPYPRLVLLTIGPYLLGQRSQKRLWRA